MAMTMTTPWPATRRGWSISSMTSPATRRSVMYFGDHPYADLADVTLHHGWHTGAVIRELEAEIITMNTDEFKWGVNWQQVLMSLIEDNQDVTDEASKEV